MTSGGDRGRGKEEEEEENWTDTHQSQHFSDQMLPNVVTRQVTSRKGPKTKQKKKELKGGDAAAAAAEVDGCCCLNSHHHTTMQPRCGV